VRAPEPNEREPSDSVRIALSVGCPCGIGPEVAIAAAAALSSDVHLVLHGDEGAILEAARVRSIDLRSLRHVTIAGTPPLAVGNRSPGAPTVAAGEAQRVAIDAALSTLVVGRADALVTGPVSKYAITSAGARFTGHTEYLEAALHATHSVMMFAGPTLRTTLVTTHLPLAWVSAAVTPQRVARVIEATAESLRDDFGVRAPRIVVCGLNPHAGENGLLGREEIDAITPGILAARARIAGFATVVGPVGAETAFRRARDGAWDVVVAMTHDQATIASKLVDFGQAVNVTLGLPIVRTSVDHGTGYDIAGQGVADAGGMIAAVELAVKIVRRRRASAPARAMRV